MQLLFYASKNDKNEKRLKDAIQSASVDRTIEHFTSLDDFRDRLHRIIEPNSIMVLAAVDRKELLKMQAFHDMLTEIYIILVLPNRQKSTIRLAHLLRPRFLSMIEDDFKDLNQIVAKMIRTSHDPAKTQITRRHPSGQSRLRALNGISGPNTK